ncbi:hypothetical protein TNCV_801261 [Trichonephila clavipes]|nr:hypothetical protein TNCV_801261 [Trichonephila clavipes]
MPLLFLPKLKGPDIEDDHLHNHHYTTTYATTTTRPPTRPPLHDHLLNTLDDVQKDLKLMGINRWKAIVTD